MVGCPSEYSEMPTLEPQKTPSNPSIESRRFQSVTDRLSTRLLADHKFAHAHDPPVLLSVLLQGFDLIPQPTSYTK